jgi:hypothetical protein
MKRSHHVFSILLFMLALSFAAQESYAAEVEIEGLSVDQTSNSSFWAIEGSVRNLETHPIKGYVKIKFLNTKGHIVKSVAAAVNDSQPLGPSEVGAFLYRTFTNHFRDIVDFKVLFVEVEIKEPEEPLSPVLR